MHVEAVSVIDSRIFFYLFLQWFEVLQNVSFENEFPAEKEALINSSMQYITSYSRS